LEGVTPHDRRAGFNGHFLPVCLLRGARLQLTAGFAGAIAAMAERNLRILLVDESAARLRLLQDALIECGFAHVVCVNTSEDVLERVYATNPDVILIDVESPTRDTLEQLTLIQQKQPRPVVLFTQDQQVQSIQAAIRSGVSAYVTNGISAAEVRPAIEVAMETFRRFQALREELHATRNSLSEMKVVNRAKAMLMNEHKLTEEQAHQFLQRVAMNRKRKLVDVAREVLGVKQAAV
jgi:response regulator NasT